jgi:hypothetical protein
MFGFAVVSALKAESALMESMFFSGAPFPQEKVIKAMAEKRNIFFIKNVFIAVRIETTAIFFF